jgi:hypothetical protein
VRVDFMGSVEFGQAMLSSCFTREALAW